MGAPRQAGCFCLDLEELFFSWRVLEEEWIQMDVGIQKLFFAGFGIGCIYIHNKFLSNTPLYFHPEETRLGNFILLLQKQQIDCTVYNKSKKARNYFFPYVSSKR